MGLQTSGRVERIAFFVLAIGIAALAGARPDEPLGGENAASPIVVDAIEIGAVEARAGALLLSGQAGGDIDGALSWSLSERGHDGRTIVPFVVEVEGGTLLAGGSDRRIAIGIYAYVVDAEGRVISHIADGVVLDPAVYRDRIVASGLKFVGRFALEPGDFTLRVMVHNPDSGRYFMSWSLLTLPFADDPGPQLLPPVFPDSNRHWFVVRQPDGEATISVGGESRFLPAARPAIVENQPTEVYFGGGGWNAEAVVEVSIINEFRRTVSAPLVEFSGPSTGDFQFRRAVLAPVDLPPGNYTMIVTLEDDSGNEALRRATRLVVVRDGERQTWAGVRNSDSSEGQSETTYAREQAEKTNKKEIRAGYRQALRPLGDGDMVTARRMVADLERRTTENPSRAAVLALSESELAEAKLLSKANPVTLMPLAFLHWDLYRGYAARGEGVLASHARNMAITFAEQLGREKPYNGFSEGLLVAFASDLAQGGSSGGARSLLERALQLNPGFRPAMLSLGFIFERNAAYPDAVTVYQGLVNTHRDFDEGLLRLAINLIRTGRDDKGEEVLRGLLDDGARPWIEAIAAQELVQLLVQKGQEALAEKEVRAALERMPGDQRLWILLADMLERSGRHDEAVEVLGDLPPAGRGVSPRARYAEWPALGVRASQTHLSARASEAVPALSTALSARGAD